MPGDGWQRGDEVLRYRGELRDDQAVFETDVATLEVAGGKLTVIVDGETVATLGKIDRKSPTLGQQPPAEATVLFDGSSVDQWENGKLIDDRWLGATNAATKAKLGDHVLHIEFTAAKYEEGEKTKNARVTIKHNGVLIHDDLELPNGTPGYRTEGPEKESLFLQNHGDPVIYRNIWVLEK